jgi:very-short-patch-repair endonuclease
MIKNKIKYIFQKTFDNCRNPKTNYKLKFDFYIPSKNILIEYDGRQHFEMGYIGGNGGKYFTTNKDMRELKYRDAIKTKFAVDNCIPLLRINYKNLHDIENTLGNIYAK